MTIFSISDDAFKHITNCLKSQHLAALLGACRELQAKGNDTWKCKVQHDYPEYFQSILNWLASHQQNLDTAYLTWPHGLTWHRIHGACNRTEFQPGISLCLNTCFMFKLWELNDGRIVSVSEKSSVIWNPHDSSIQILEHDEIKDFEQLDRERFIFSDTHGDVFIWNPLTNSLEQCYREENDANISCLLRLRNGNILMGSELGSLFRLNRNEKILRKIYTTQYPARIHALLGLEDGGIAFSTDCSTSADILAIFAQNGITPLEGHTDTVDCLIQLPNGYLVSGSSDYTIKIWKLNGTPPITLTGHEKRVTTLLPLQNGNFASASEDGNIIIWNSEGEQIKILKGDADSPVTCLTQLPCGRIVSGSAEDTYARIWNQNDETYQTLEGDHEGGFSYVLTLSNGCIVSGSRYKCKLQIWKPDIDSALSKEARITQTFQTIL